VTTISRFDQIEYRVTGYFRVCLIFALFANGSEREFLNRTNF